jgi:hypothetical protein
MAKKRSKKRPPARASRPPQRDEPRPAAPAAKPTRAQRIEAAQAQRRRRRLAQRALVAGVLVVIVGSVAAVVINNRRQAQRTISRLEAGECRFDRESDEDAGQGRNHVTGSVDYRTDPPAGGNHSATAASPNVYSNPVPPDEQLVHAMEHGDIVLWHRPDAGPDLLDELRSLADRYEGDVLVVPRASMPTPVAATAWHRRLLCPTFERAALDLFVSSFRDKGPEKLPEG